MKPRVEDGRRTWFASCYSLSNIAHALRLALGRSAHVTSYGQPAKHELVDLRVLVVEDNPISQLILREQLEHLAAPSSRPATARKRWRCRTPCRSIPC